MKRTLFVTCLLAGLWVQAAVAREHPFGLGVITGEPSGISGKLWLSEKTAVDGAMAWWRSPVGDSMLQHIARTGVAVTPTLVAYRTFALEASSEEDRGGRQRVLDFLECGQNRLPVLSDRGLSLRLRGLDLVTQCGCIENRAGQRGRPFEDGERDQQDGASGHEEEQ